MLQSILELLYPVRCPICANIVLPKGDMICPACRDKLQPIIEPRCMKCSKPIEVDEKEYCNDCLRMNYHYIRGYSLWVYDVSMKKSIGDFKYRNKREYGTFYIQEIICLYGRTIEKMAPDVIIPVPIHRSKYMERGYNQAEVLARGVSKELGIPVLSRLLIRSRKTLPQKQLDNKARLRNLQQAFSLDKKEEASYKGQIQRALIIDDIYTTGSTIEACTNVLIQYGIKEVYFLTLCIGQGY